MKTRSRCAGAVRAMLVLAAAGLLAACAPPLGYRGEGNLRIVLADGTGARAASQDIPGSLSYKLDFSGPNGENDIHILDSETQVLTLNLALGDWTIHAEASAGGKIYGSGEEPVTVEAGKAKEVTIRIKRALADITGFSFTAPPATGNLDPAAKTVTVPVHPGTDLSSLIPTITVSTGAVIVPPSEAAQDFTLPLTYTVTAANGFTETWTVTVTELAFLNTIAEVTAYLDFASGGTDAADPVPLPVALNLADPGGNGWADLLGAINAGGKYVSLDLSACEMGSTEFDPGHAAGAAAGTANTGKGRIVSLILPAGAKSVKAGTDSAAAFRYFTGLRGVTGLNIEAIGEYAFAGCTGLSTANFPGVKTIGEGAFQGCTGLSSITLPASLETLGANPFAGCINLTNITVDPGSPGYKHSSDKKMLLSKDGGTLIGYPAAVGNITLSGITSLGDYAFAGCTGLTAVNLPLVTNIGSGAFGSTGTAALTLTLGAEAPMLGVNMFLGVTAKTVTVRVPAGAAGYGSSPADTTTANWGNGFRGGGWDGSALTGGTVNSGAALTITPVYLSGITELRAYLASAPGGGDAANPVPVGAALDLSGDAWRDLLTAISGADKYVALDLSLCTMNEMTGTPGEFDPDYTNSAGKNRIVSLVLPDEAESITGGTWDNDVLLPAFRYFANLKSVAGAAVNDIGASAFSGCSSLITVDFPAVTGIGDAAFRGCTGLSSITLPSSLASLGENPFAGCTGLTSITVDTANPDYKHSSDKKMLLSKDGGALISYPAAAGNITLSGITSLGDYAFRGCTTLTGLSSSSVASVGYSVFQGCTGLTNVSLPAATIVMDSAFSDCASLTTVDLSGLISVSANTFYGCTSLTTVNHPLTARTVKLPLVTEIEDYVFSGCSSLTTVILPLVTKIESYVFSGCTSLSAVLLPSVTEIGSYAFQDTGGTDLDVTLGAEAPTLGVNMFQGVAAKHVEIAYPAVAAYYGSTPTDTTSPSWGNGFRGGGWNGSALTGGTVNGGIFAVLGVF